MSDLAEAIDEFDNPPIGGPSETATVQVLAAARRVLGGEQVQWCEVHDSPPLRDGWDDGGFRNPDGSSRCAMSFLMHEGYDDDYNTPCSIVQATILKPAKHCDHDWEYDPWEYGGRTCKKCGGWEGSGGRR